MNHPRLSRRMEALGANVFADMDRAKARARAAGHPIVDLSLGSSDLAAPPRAIEAIERALRVRETHGYLLHGGTLDFRAAVASWYTDRYGVFADAETEVLPLIGSQEGTAHLPLALLDPGDFALLLDPGYPSHSGGVTLAGGRVYPLPLREEKNFLPDLEEIPSPVLARARMMVLSYPHNPTTAMAPLDFFERAVDFCREHGLFLVHDFPYHDIFFDDAPAPPSVLQADRDKERSIEFFTFSKSYNMGGFRVGFAIGNARAIAALRQIKASVDFNQYRGILDGAIAALRGNQDPVQETVAAYRERRDAFIAALARVGWSVSRPRATPYVWARLPEPWRRDSVDFCTRLVAGTGIAASPGAGFGKCGEGYVRFALVHEPAVLTAAAARVAEFSRSSP